MREVAWVVFDEIHYMRDAGVYRTHTAQITVLQCGLEHSESCRNRSYEQIHSLEDCMSDLRSFVSSNKEFACRDKIHKHVMCAFLHRAKIAI